jgi:hypothetical protein
MDLSQQYYRPTATRYNQLFITPDLANNRSATIVLAIAALISLLTYPSVDFHLVFTVCFLRGLCWCRG